MTTKEPNDCNCSNIIDCLNGKADDACIVIDCYVVISLGGFALFIIFILSICLYWQCRINTQLKNMYIPKPDETNHPSESSSVASVAPAAEEVISTHSVSPANNQGLLSEHSETEKQDAELKTFGLRKKKVVRQNSAQCLVFCSEDKSSNGMACNGDQIKIISITNIEEDTGTSTDAQAISISMKESSIECGSTKVIVDEEIPVNQLFCDVKTTSISSNGIMPPLSVEMSDLSSNQRSETEFENTGNSTANLETTVKIEDTNSDKILDNNITLKTDRHIDDAHIYELPSTGEEENNEPASIYASNIVPICKQNVHKAEKKQGADAGVDVFRKSTAVIEINSEDEHYEIIGRPTPGSSMVKIANCDLPIQGIHKSDGINCNTKAIHCMASPNDPLNDLESRVEPVDHHGVKIGVLPDIDCSNTASVKAMSELDNLSGSVENIIYVSGDNDEAPPPRKPIPTDHYINVGALYSKLEKHANLTRSDSPPIGETNK